MEFLLNAEFWVAVAFVIAIGLMWWKGWGAVAAMLDSRAEQIRNDLNEAKRLRDEAEKLLADYKRRQSEALTEAGTIAARARAEAEMMSQQAKADLEASMKRREIQAKERIAQAEAAAIAEVRAATVDIAINAARRLIMESLNAERGSELIEQSIQNLPARLH